MNRSKDKMAASGSLYRPQDLGIGWNSAQGVTQSRLGCLYAASSRPRLRHRTDEPEAIRTTSLAERSTLSDNRPLTGYLRKTTAVGNERPAMCARASACSSGAQIWRADLPQGPAGGTASPNVAFTNALIAAISKVGPDVSTVPPSIDA